MVRRSVGSATPPSVMALLMMKLWHSILHTQSIAKYYKSASKKKLSTTVTINLNSICNGLRELKEQSASTRINQHQSASSSIIQHQSASIRNNQHQSASISINQHQSVSLSINQHQSEWISINQHHSASIKISQRQPALISTNLHSILKKKSMYTGSTLKISMDWVKIGCWVHTRASSRI